MSSPARPVVLVIDDDEELRALMAHMLGKAGFETLGAEDGELGLARARTRAPDLIVLDLMMPKLDGFGVLRAMQAAGMRIPVVVVTGYSTEANEQILRSEPNVVEFLPKPVNYEELVGVIRKVLKL